MDDGPIGQARPRSSTGRHEPGQKLVAQSCNVSRKGWGFWQRPLVVLGLQSSAGIVRLVSLVAVALALAVCRRETIGGFLSSEEDERRVHTGQNTSSRRTTVQ